MGTEEEEGGVAHGINIVGRAAGGSGNGRFIGGHGAGGGEVMLLWGNRHDDYGYEDPWRVADGTTNPRWRKRKQLLTTAVVRFRIVVCRILPHPPPRQSNTQSNHVPFDPQHSII